MSEIFLLGVSASEGMATGILVQRELHRHDSAGREIGDAKHEQGVLHQALEQAHTVISKLITKLDQTATEIMEFQLALLDDEYFLAPAFISINGGMSAHEAWLDMMDAEIATYATADDNYMATKVDDLLDLRETVLEAIAGKSDASLPTYSRGTIIATGQITPSEFLKFASLSISAIAVVGGSPSSHVAILARSRGIPMMVGCDSELLKIPSGSTALLDADMAQIIVNPQKTRKTAFQHKLDQYRDLEKQANRLINEPALTRDGERITIYANVDDSSLLSNIDITPFDGVGLTRTEFLFENGDLPNEDTQFETYRSILNWADGRPATIRTLDAGGDKPIRGITVAEETNPFLGLRGYRLSQSNRDVFKTQLRALARAAVLGPLKVMIPMVTIPSEMEQFRKIFTATVVELKSEGCPCVEPPLGMMIEVPAAALEVESFDADFYSIGSNDLVQYTLAAARDDPNLRYLVDHRNPAILNLIGIAIRASAERNVEISICGDMASVPESIQLLLGLGVRTLSVAISQVAKVKQSIRQWGRGGADGC